MRSPAPFASTVRPSPRPHPRNSAAQGQRPQPGRRRHHIVEHCLSRARHRDAAGPRRGHFRRSAEPPGAVGLAAHQSHRRLPMERGRRLGSDRFPPAQARRRAARCVMFFLCPLSVCRAYQPKTATVDRISIPPAGERRICRPTAFLSTAESCRAGAMCDQTTWTLSRPLRLRRTV